uniref:Arginyl-tRNA synthetase catalytic core domain-containing protein n=1 Tax=Cannabis sativa TaxID=3483 RepID=A0A803PA61_CANSA
MMDKLIQIQRATEPLELLKLVKKVKNELSSEVMITELPQHLQQSIADEVIQRLKTLGARANISEQGGHVFLRLNAHIFLCSQTVCELPLCTCSRLRRVIEKEDEIIACDASPMSVVFLACHRVLKEGESFYNPHIPRVIRELRELELVKESEGACVISIEGVISFPLNVVKSGDGFN